MEQHLHAAEFEFFLSAFLAVIYTLKESRTLDSRDSRYRDWYRSTAQTKFHVYPLKELTQYRNQEVHNKGADTHTWIGMNFGEEGILVEGGQTFSMTVDLSSTKPVACYSIDGEVTSMDVKTQWVWGIHPNEVDVMDTCRAGLNTFAEVLRNRAAQNFID